MRPCAPQVGHSFSAFNYFSFTLSTSCVLSVDSRSTVGLTLQLTTSGLVLKLRLQRYSQRLIFPIYLACYPSTALVMAAAAIRASAVSTARHLVRRRCCKVRMAAAAAQKKVEQTQLQREETLRQSAAVEAKLLLPEAVRVAREELAVGGLLILAAF